MHHQGIERKDPAEFTGRQHKEKKMNLQAKEVNEKKRY
jgi:hypothetical protein